MELLIGVVVGLIILVLLVVVHELGHGIVARRNGVVVEEFGVGFPPKAWGKKVKRSFLGKNVLFSLNWLPLGGFVKLQGENDAADKKGDYGAATYWVKTKILLAGVGINWLVAALLFTILALFGLPKLPVIDNQFSIASDTVVTRTPVQLATIVNDSPADRAGLQSGDEVVRINDTAITDAKQVSNFTASERGETISITYKRDGIEQAKQLQLDDKESGNLGASLGQREFIKATWSAPLVGIGTTVQFTWITLQGLGDVLVNFVSGLLSQLNFNADVRSEGSEKLATVSNSVAGPVGILGVIFPSATEAGLTQLLFLTAIISLTLAVMNALPIPALDGGRWFLMTLYRLRKKELTKEKEEQIVGISFMVLLGLIVLITIADIGKF